LWGSYFLEGISVASFSGSSVVIKSTP
jgi:hypothetical protein